MSCPHGVAWADYPTATDEAHAGDVECSGMGYCDHDSGTCVCRANFEGPACERMACPTDNSGTPCSGHGRCVSTGQAAELWDGRTLVRPNVSYGLWDAEKMQGCACDLGYSGFNCSRVDCPRGDIPETTGQRNEVARLECLADPGTFALTFRGYRTAAIPYDVPYGQLEKYLEDLPTVRDVAVTYLGGATAACGAGAFVETEIEFRSEFGSLPALRATNLDLGDGSDQGRCGCGTCRYRPESRAQPPSRTPLVPRHGCDELWPVARLLRSRIRSDAG